jgi:hypothetical protein
MFPDRAQELLMQLIPGIAFVVPINDECLDGIHFESDLKRPS